MAKEKKGIGQRYIPHTHLEGMLECTSTCFVSRIPCENKSGYVKDIEATELLEHVLGYPIAMASVLAALHTHFLCKSHSEILLTFYAY